MDLIDTLDDWLEDRWRALTRPWSPSERARRLRWSGVASASLAVHMAVLVYFGSQLTDAYRLPEPPPEVIEPVEPMEAILVPPPEPPEPLPPELRRLEPVPQPTPQPTPTQAPPAPVPTPTPTPAPPRPTPPTPTPPRPTPPTPLQGPPAPVTAANRPVVRVNPTVTPTLPDPAPPAVAPPAPRPAPPAPTREEDEDEEDRPIARTTPNEAPRQVAPSAPPSTVSPLPMAPVPRAAAPAGGAGRPPPPGGANGDFTVRSSGVVGSGGLRGVLRSTVGCDNRNAVALNKGERNTCDELAGERGARAAPIAVGTELSREKRGRMQTQAEINEAMRTYRTAPASAGTPTPQGSAAPRVRDLVGGQ